MQHSHYHHKTPSNQSVSENIDLKDQATCPFKFYFLFFKIFFFAELQI